MSAGPADRPAPKAVVFYHSAPDVLDRAPSYMAAHGAVIDEFHGTGIGLTAAFGVELHIVGRHRCTVFEEVVHRAVAHQVDAAALW